MRDRAVTAALVATIIAISMDFRPHDTGAVILSAIVFSYVLTSGGIK
jgi:hypothetical protein